MVELIVKWRQSLQQYDQPFVWNGSNYLLKMCSDTDFLASSKRLLSAMGVEASQLQHNPFLMPKKLDYFDERGNDGMSMEGFPPLTRPNSAEDEASEYSRLTFAERVLVREQQLDAEQSQGESREELRWGKLKKRGAPTMFPPVASPSSRLTPLKGTSSSSLSSDLLHWQSLAQQQVEMLRSSSTYSQRLRRSTNMAARAHQQHAQSLLRTTLPTPGPAPRKLSKNASGPSILSKSLVTPKLRTLAPVNSALLPSIPTPRAMPGFEIDAPERTPSFMRMKRAVEDKFGLLSVETPPPVAVSSFQTNRARSVGAQFDASPSSSTASLLGWNGASSLGLSPDAKELKENARRRRAYGKLPALGLTPDALRRLASMRKAPPSITVVCATVAILLSPGDTLPADLSWTGQRRAMSCTHAYLSQLSLFKGDDIPQFKIRALQPFLASSDFDSEFLRTVSPAASALCAWVMNIVLSQPQYMEWLGDGISQIVYQRERTRVEMNQLRREEKQQERFEGMLMASEEAESIQAEEEYRAALAVAQLAADQARATEVRLARRRAEAAKKAAARRREEERVAFEAAAAAAAAAEWIAIEAELAGETSVSKDVSLPNSLSMKTVSPEANIEMEPEVTVIVSANEYSIGLSHGKITHTEGDTAVLGDSTSNEGCIVEEPLQMSLVGAPLSTSDADEVKAGAIFEPVEAKSVIEKPSFLHGKSSNDGWGATPITAATATLPASATEPTAEPAVGFTVEPASEPVAEPAVEPAAEPATETEPVEPAAKPASEAAAECAVEAAAEPAVDLVCESATKSASKTAAVPASEDVVETVVEPAAELLLNCC